MKEEATETPLIDTSKMSEEKRAALEATEEAREVRVKNESLASSLFMGSPIFSKINPFPAQSAEDKKCGDAFLHQLEELIDQHLDPDKIDAEGEIPDSVIEKLQEIGAFGIKIPTQYGGLGLSQTNYSRAAMLLGQHCGNTTALLSAHQSIGVPQPLLLFGTEAQKERFLPRFAKGEISAFALTEPDVGSDPSKMTTTATPTEDGTAYFLNGKKLWCTNLLKAGVIVVMAKTPAKIIHGKEREQITAFIVELDTPGVKITHRCHFMGLKALYNGIVTFNQARIPKENILLAEGKGLKVALSTLNTGRITLPAACSGLTQRCLEISSQWGQKREQWGAPIGKHSAIANKIARIAGDAFAMKAMTLYVSGLLDQNKKADIRIEAAMAKMWGSERSWDAVNETMQIRGGRGYETAASLKARGEEGIPIERLFRDSRINTIFEGSSEIMRLFIAREALETHLRIGAAVLNSSLPFKKRVAAALKASFFYALWYPKQWLPTMRLPKSTHPDLKKHLRRVRGLSKKLARTLFHSILKYGPKLEQQQVLLARFVDIGTELFAITAACTKAQEDLQKGDKKDFIPLVNYFCHSSELRIQQHFQNIRKNNDKEAYKYAQKIMRT